MARSLMVVGTASHVGKSLIVTALCRILRNRGIRVAPFKSQNIALNSFVCGDGAEIGRAQVVQAEAAGLEPEPDMNPILLKPSSGGRFQVVLNGSVYATMTGDEYSEKRRFFFDQAQESYRRLEDRYEAIILEGAGSAAEINLMDRDIVNLPFAMAVGAPAVLVADIDRGGVFASVVGTFDLLEPTASETLRGFIINRFRGDAALFADGVRFLEQRTGQRCFGVVPYIDSLDIDQEDGVSLDERLQNPAEFRVGVVQLPHISNYTDFNPLERVDGVAVDYLRTPAGPFPEVLIIPGSKNTIRDLEWIRERGFDPWFRGALRSGSFVMGICGGYQMLGTRVSDPSGVEEGGWVEGLGLLDVDTELREEKTTLRSEGRSFLGPTIRGYEIHMGRSTPRSEGRPFAVKADGSRDGLVSDGVCGTYFHGIFENEEFTREFLTMAAVKHGMSWRPALVGYSKDATYDRLATEAAAHLDADLLNLLTPA